MSKRTISKQEFNELLENYKKAEIERTGKAPQGQWGNLAFHKFCERNLKLELNIEDIDIK